jgi:hypothetical protein
MDPPDALESNKNELIYADWQYNRNPFIDHPEWVEQIWAPTQTATASPTRTKSSPAPPQRPQLRFRSHPDPHGNRLRFAFLRFRLAALRRPIPQQRSRLAAVAETNRLQSGTLRFPVAPPAPPPSTTFAPSALNPPQTEGRHDATNTATIVWMLCPAWRPLSPRARRGIARAPGRGDPRRRNRCPLREADL